MMPSEELFMRTTLSLDDDVIQKAKKAAVKSGKPFRQVVNAALRAGLDIIAVPAEAAPYQTKAHKMGLRTGKNLDNVQELLAQIEGEDAQ
jgi:Arc/MetJ family transcription regulator